MADQSVNNPPEVPQEPPTQEIIPEEPQSAVEIDLFGDPNRDLSNGDIDLFLKDKDPDFMDALDKVGADKSIQVIEPEVVVGDIDELAAKERWENSKGVLRLLYRIFPGVVKISVRWRKFKFKIFSRLNALWVRFTNFCFFLVTQGRQRILAAMLNLLKRGGQSLSEMKESWNKLTAQQKLVVTGLILSGTGAIAFLGVSWTRGIIPHEKDLFMRTLDPLATEIYTYDPATESEPFYENLRTGLHILHIEKIVVNVKRSKNSTENPMAAFDFFIEGSSPDVLVEIKEKEIRLRDQIQRTIEGFTFDQLESGDGKQDLTQTIEKELNAVLTTGRVRSVRIKTAIVKP